MKKLLLFFMSFFTFLGYAQFPEGFENAAIALNTSPPATGWATFNNGIATNNWIRSNTQTPRGTALARITQQQNVTNGINSLHWLVSPAVTIPVNGQVRFYSKQAQLADFNGEYTVRISTTSQTDPTTFTTVQTYDEATVSPMTGTPAVPAWEQKFVLLPTYVGQTVYIAFVKKNAGGDTWVIDDVKVDSQCLTPTTLIATPLATSASLSWTSPNPAGPWVIEYGPAGFVPGTGTLVNAATNPFNLTGLTSLTGYTFYVRTLCDTDNPSPWSNSGNFITSALPPECGGNFVDTGGPNANYGANQDYVVTICPPNPGDYVTVTFTSFNVEANWDKLYVYDGNSTASPQIASANGPGNGAVLIPGAYWGTVIPGPFEATGTSGCLTFRFVSDGDTSPGWTANIVCQPYPTCRKPTNITSNAISPTSVTVSWTNNAPSATLWEVIAVPVGSPAPTAAMTGQTTTNPTTYTYTGLTSQTAYNFYVRAICATGTDVGPWSTTFSTSTTNPNYCGGDHFYDSGGATGNYGNNETRTWTICPTNTGDVVTVYFNSFNLISSIGDALTIYDGNSTAGTVVGTFYGTNIIPSYTASSPSGCLTFRFVSNATLNSAGWDATIVCGPPCPSITSVLNSTVPVAGSENTIRICQGATVQFNGSGTFAASGTGATYVWNFNDGTTATGQNVSHAFTNPGIYLVNLTITDPNGCRNSNRLDQKVYVSTTPSFTGTQAADDDICLGETTTITGAVSPTPFTRVCAPPVSGTTFLPDGAGNSYISFVPVDCFPFGSTITAANQITSVCIDMEHSYLGDLEIRLVSPTGQSIILKAYPGGGGTYLGCPLDDPAVGPGTGRTYCFTPAATTLLVNGPTSPCGTPSSASINAGNYMPVQPFTNLIGSQLNGNWSIIVTDNLGIDNGYIFNWSINFDNSILPTDYSFTPTIVNTFWSPSPSIASTTGQTISVLPTAAGNHCYTYNAVDNFGCTYSQQVCIDVAPGVTLTSNTANPLSVYVGQNGTYYFSGGTPNAIVTYNVNGGANQQVTLDASGNATVVVNSLAVNTTVTATRVDEQPIVVTGNVILTTGGINPTNSHGVIEPAGTVATVANCTTVDFNNDIVSLKLGHQLPIGTVITISIAKNNNQGSVQITDGTNTITFDSGAINVLQRISFTMGRVTDIITITRNAGNVFVDGIAYTFNITGCTAAVNLPATVTVTPPPFPFITSITNDANICLGANAIFTVLGSANTTVTYSINGGSTQTILLNGAGQGTITVNAPPASVNLLVSQIQLGTDISNIALTRTIIVNPLGQVNPITSQTVCQGTGTGAVVFSTSNTTGTTTYTWTNDNPAIGLAAASTGAATGIPSFVAQNATTAPISGLITVVPTYTSGGVSCIGTATTFTITVNPTPQISNKTAAICSGATFTVTPVNGTASDILAINTTYSWTFVDNTNVTGESNQSNQTAISQQLFNTTAAAQTVTYTVTPIGSNGCIGNTFTVTVTVNPEPVVANQTAATCSDVALNYSLDGLITGAGDTYTYTVASSNATSVPAGSPRAVASAANITDVYTNTTIAPVTITYTVTPTSATGCTGNTFTVTVTVNPEPVVTNQTITTCSDVALNYSLASLITGTGDLYTYTVASSNAASVPAGSPRAVASAANITDVYTNTTASPVTITYTVTPIGANGCTGNTFTVTVTVNPEPVVTNQTITTCSNVALNYSLDALISGAGDTYTYTVASSNATSVPAGSPRAIASAANITDVYTNTTIAPVTITYTITPIGSNGCTGNTFTVIVTVDPIATVVATPVSNFICTGSTTSIAITSPTTGTAPVTFNWTASILTAPTAGTITGFSSDNTGTLNIISQTLQNTGTSVGVVRYVVTPYIGLCPGTPVNVDITVNPLGQVDAIPNLVVCPGDVTTSVGFTSSNTGNTTYTWTNDTPSIGLAASGSTNSIPSFTAINTTASPIVATITVTPTFVDGSVSCLGTSTSFTITVNPTPTIILSSAVSSTNQIICVNTPITPIQYTFGANATGVIITGLPTGVTFAINGSIVTISGTPTTTSAATFNYVITTAGNSCGAPNLSGTIEVTNGILPLFNQVVPVCQGATINIPTTSTNGIIGVWNLVSTTANNVTYQFIPNPGQCALNTTMTIVVHPLPVVTPSVTSQSFCSGGTTSINLTSNVPGATFSWTATATTITGQAGSVTGSGATSINQTLILNANQVAAGQVTYVIVAEANGCLGAPVTVVVTVNPVPNVVVSPTTQTICSGQTTSISFSGAINNTVFTWNVLSSVGVSGAFNGTGNAINQTLITTGLSQGTVVYEVTPTLNGCVGMPQTITVTVNPVPELFGSATHPELCSGESTFISVSTFSATTVFNWVVEPFGVSGASAGTATGSSILIEQALRTTGNAQGYVDYIITPVLTACAGTPITVRVYVNPLPVVSLTDGTICVNAAGVPFQTYLLDSGLDNANYDFVWTFEGNTIPNATQATYSAGEVGTYTVVATNSTTNCVSNIARAVVTATNPATAITVTQSDYFSNNATLTVTVTGGNGTLLYQLDEGILQESNVFTGVTGGPHIITVVDTQGCTYLTQEVFIIDYPRYFTPNGDGYNDTWNITGLNQPDAKLFIFDRYGKLIKQIAPSSSSSGWDGAYNNSSMPSTDYWFTLDYTENGAAKQFKAHFSLKR